MAANDTVTAPVTGPSSTSWQVAAAGFIGAVLVFLAPHMGWNATQAETMTTTITSVVLALGAVGIKIYHDLKRRQFQTAALAAGSSAATLAPEVQQALVTLSTAFRPAQGTPAPSPATS